MAINYGKEKLTRAINILATDRGRIKGRLFDACISSLVGIKPDEDLPSELGPEYVELYNRVTSEKAVGNEGKLQATIERMSEDEAQECAEQMFSLWFRLFELRF